MVQLTIQQAFDLAVQNHQAGGLREAEQLYRQILAQEPTHAGALHYLGVIAGQMGRHDVAVDLIRRAIALRPNHFEAFNNLGNSLKDMGQIDEAITAYRNALALNPNFPEASYNLGNALKTDGQIDEAIAAYRRAIVLKPDYAKAHNNLGDILRNKGQRDEASAAFRKALLLDPHLPEAHNNLGNVLRDEGRFDEAIAAYRTAIAVRPGYGEAWNNLGNALRDKGELEQAIAAYRQAILLNPGLPEVYSNLGTALKDSGQLDEAVATHRQAIAIQPNHAEAHSNLLFTMHFHPACDAQNIAEEHRRWNRQHAEPLRNLIQAHLNDRNLDRRLRIGYVSADFRQHSVSSFLIPLIERHDRPAFEVFFYSDVAAPDAITARLRRHADRWHAILGRSDQQVADLIRGDEIDILVDLAGHTAGNPLLVFARRPAPVQVTYLGYPNTTGMTAIDYRITDAFADEPGYSDCLCAETLIRLPGSFLCFSPDEETPPVGPLPATANNQITFGCFNAGAKINEPFLNLWSRILNQIPASRLLLKNASLADSSTRRRLLATLESFGIAEERLALVGYISSRAEHLGFYNHVDIALDTFPYHGTTTTCEALWMGVPVITLAGKTHVSRVGVSLLSNIDHREWIAQTPEAYVQIAIDLAQDRNRLVELRRGMRAHMLASPLMDAEGFTRDMEKAFRQMWHTWCETMTVKS